MEFEHLVTRYLAGEMDPDELLGFEAKLRQDPARQALLEEYRKIWDSVGSFAEKTDYDLDAEWTRLQQKLPGFGSGRREVTGHRVRPLFKYVYRIAAVLVAGMLFTFAWYYVTRMSGMEKVVAGNEPVELQLKDGTHLVVNRNSTVRFRKQFDGEERKVYLSGEAWFDVARDTTAPFMVDVGSAVAEVLGTSFNVNAYKESPLVEITVTSGVVALSAKQDLQEQIVMQAGNGGTFHKKQKELTLIPSSDPNNLAWKTRELIFDSSTLQEVADLVSKVYGVEIVITNRELASCPITVSFRDQSLEAILNVLEETLELDITRTGDEIRLHGEGCIQ